MTRIAVVGANGMLGSALVKAAAASGHDVVRITRADIDLENAESLRILADDALDVIVNTAAWTDVDGCAREPDRAIRINGVGAGLVAGAAAEAGALCVFISTNEIFDGVAEQPYAEDRVPSPVNPYGASKLAGERAVANAGPHLIVRTAWLFDADSGFPARIAAAAGRAAARGETLRVVDDEWGNPTWVPSLAASIVRLIGLRLDGQAPDIVHLAGEPPTTRFAWARQVLRDHPVRLIPIRGFQYQRSSRVPPRAVLSTALAARLGLEPLEWQAAS